MTSSNSRRARPARRGVIAIGVVSAIVGLAGPAPALAAPVSVTLDYTCNFPLMDPQPLALTITTDIPTAVAVGERTNPFDITAKAQVSAGATRGLSALETATIEGTASADAVVLFPDGSDLPIKVPTTIPKISLPASGSFITNATGRTPPLVFDVPGETRITVGDLLLKLTPRLADGTLTGLDLVETECFQKPGQQNTLARIQVGTEVDTPPTAPTNVRATPTTNAIGLTWNSSQDDKGVAGYDIVQDDVVVQTVTGTAATLTSLESGRAYRIRIVAKDTKGQTTSSTEVSSTTLKPSGGDDFYRYGLTGAAAIKTLTKGNVPLKGGLNVTVNQSTKAATADLTLDRVRANLTALGFIPVTADIVIAPTAPATGTLTSGALKLQAKARIRLPQVLLFGSIPLAGGTNCQTRSASTINLQSTAGFDPAAGGNIAGSFAISDLSGCGFLTGIVSPLTSGGGNTLAAKLVPVK